ncbi:MAG: hypothetical protein V3S24_11530, partial [Candidatus Tectomicrobia bacterium]
SANVLQRHHAEGKSPYCGENSEPGRHITESLTSIPELENSLDHKATLFEPIECVSSREES